MKMIRRIAGRAKRQILWAAGWARGKLNRGYCTICDRRVWFHEIGPWLRDQYICLGCGSISRNRALIEVLNGHFATWREARIHEFSSGGPSSDKIRRECPGYIASQFFVDVAIQLKDGQRSEDLENLTFEDRSFDLVITQDVFEHVLRPGKTFAEIAR